MYANTLEITNIDIRQELLSCFGKTLLRSYLPLEYMSPKNDKRLCKYCEWNIEEEQDPQILYFFHSDCWKEYRKDGLVDPMPEYTW